jgi:hypothetical protein
MQQLVLRPTGLSSPAYRDQLDYVVIEDSRTIGRMYEDKHAPPDVCWFWSITLHVDPALGITTNGRVPSLEEAKTRFKSSWSRVREHENERQKPPT